MREPKRAGLDVYILLAKRWYLQGKIHYHIIGLFPKPKKKKYIAKRLIFAAGYTLFIFSTLEVNVFSLDC
jgi:hypothetical protein